MAGQYRSITRDQLARFLPDPESIKRFEQLFQSAEQTTPAATEEANAAAVSAQASATAAQAAVAALADALGPSLALAESRALQALDASAKLSDAVARLEAAPPYPEPRQSAYGVFYDTTTQTAAAINTATLITFNTTDVAYGVYRAATTSRITVTRAALYNFQFSIQLDNTSGGNHLAYIWCRVNGSDVPQSASQVRLKGTDGELVAAWNFVLSLKADDYFELVYSVTDTAVQLVAQAAAAPVPAIPSVILTVTDNI
jgi:hypothetical protein